MKLPLPSLQTDIPFFTNINQVEILTFTKHISLMLKSGIALPEAIEILENQTTHTAFKDVLKRIHEEIANGQNFSKALSLFPHVFDIFYISLIKTAEESGTYEKNLDYLAEHLKKQHEFSNKIRGALLYPSIVLAVAGITGMGLSIFVLPKLIDLFSSLDVELPLSTKLLLGFAHIMQNYGILILFTLILVFILFKFSITTRFVKPGWHAFLLSLPLLGVFIQNIQLAAVFRNLGTMLQVGLPIGVALDTQQEVTTNYVYKEILDDFSTGARKGKSLQEVIHSSHTKYIPLIAERMIGVGEKTGKLDETLIYLGDYFEEEVDDVSKNFSTVLEPIVLLAVGLIVAFIAISIIGPIYQFTGSIKQ